MILGGFPDPEPPFKVTSVEVSVTCPDPIMLTFETFQQVVLILFVWRLKKSSLSNTISHMINWLVVFLRCCPKNHGISKLVVRRSKRTLQKTHPNPSKSQGPVVLKVDKRKQQKTPTQHIRVVLTIPRFPKKNAPTCTLPRNPSRR